MTYIVTKIIKGNPYLYEVRSQREGDRVRQIFVRYLGRADKAEVREQRAIARAEERVTPPGEPEELEEVQEVITPEVEAEILETPIEEEITPSEIPTEIEEIISEPEPELKPTGKRVGNIPKDFSSSPKDFISEDYLSGEETAFFHVTTAKDKVLSEGLKPRKETGSVALGGGFDEQSPDKISVTFDESQALAIADRIIMAIKSAKGEITPTEIIDGFDRDYRFGDDAEPTTIGDALDAPDNAKESWESFDEWLDEEYKGNEYELVQKLDDALPKIFTDPESFGYRVGLTASSEQMAKLEPEQVEVLTIAGKKGAIFEHISDEAELRFNPDDIWVVSETESKPEPVPEEPIDKDVESEVILYHGTKAEYKDEDISTGKRMYGIHLTTDEDVAKIYGDVKKYTLSEKTRILDLSDGESLWEFMEKEGILDEDDIANIDLENYVKGGQLFQYDISSNTSLADDVAKTAEYLGYDLIKMSDDLGSKLGEDVAYVVVNRNILQSPEETPTKPKPEEPVGLDVTKE